MPSASPRLAVVVLFASVTMVGAQPALPMQPCRVAEDGYGLSADQPVQVGGGMVYGAARQQRYLRALRGPGGEPLTFERKGTTGDPEKGLVDRYEVRPAGAAAPLVVYLDFYHFTDTVLAPRGLTCGPSVELGMPPPDLFMARAQLEALAVEMAGEKGFRAPPVELGTPPALLISDGFRQMTATARANARKEQPSPAAAGSLPKVPPGTAVIAYPWSCGDRMIAPSAIALSDRRAGSIKPASTTSEAGAMRTLAAGAPVPAGSLAAVFQMPQLQPGATVAITYAEASCNGVPPTDTFEITGSGAELLEHTMPTRPAGDAAIGRWIAVQAVIDELGAFRVARALGGPADLAAAAVTTVASWRASPARVAGHPVPTPVTLQVRFEAAEPK